MAWYNIVILVAYIGAIISLIVVVLSENRNPVKSLAWVTVLLMVPVLGIVLYLFFGRSLINTRMITRRNRRRLRKRESFKHVDIHKQGLSPQSLQEVKMAQTLSGAIYYPGNHIDLFTDGTAKFDSLIADLENARKYIHMQYYIFNDDSLGKRIAEVLIRKARQGVKVRLIYDHIGSLNTKNSFFKQLQDEGIMVHPFFRVTFPHFATRINWRNHRKIVVIDGTIGYIGGMNVAERYVTGVDYGIWRDTHARIHGPAVGGLQYAFAVDWNFMGQELLEEQCDSTVYSDQEHNAGVQIVTSGPTSQWSNIAMLYQKAIAGAKKRVFIQTPYFLPTESLLKCLQAVSLARVDVRIMIPAKSDSAILNYASFSYIRECLQAGIKVYLYEAGMLHAKTILVDDEFVSIGSTNFDFRSFEHNFEGNILVYSETINRMMHSIFIDDIAHSRRITTSEWRQRSRSQKAKESLFRLLSPVL